MLDTSKLPILHEQNKMAFIAQSDLETGENAIRLNPPERLITITYALVDPWV